MTDGKCEKKQCQCDPSYIGETCTKRIPPYPPEASIPPLYGHTAVPVDRGHAVLVFGGKSRDKSLNDYSGDDLYFNDLWWFRANWDTKLSRFLPTGMLWLPVNIPGPKPSPRSEHSANIASFGATGSSAMIIFGGYDGTGPLGYKNDMYGVINIEQDQQELDIITSEIRDTVNTKTERASNISLTVMRGFFYNEKLELESLKNCIDEKTERKHLLSTEDFKKTIKQLCERNVEEKTARIPKTYDSKKSMPWEGERIYGTWKYEEGPLSKYYGIGKPWSRKPKWIHISGSGNVKPPSPRKQHGTAVVGDLLFLIGGFGINAIDTSKQGQAQYTTDYLNDLHVFNLKEVKWINTGYETTINNNGDVCSDETSPKSMECNQGAITKFVNDPKIVSGTPPSPRAGFTLTSYLFNLLLYGGVGGHSMAFPDQELYVLDTGCRYGAQGTPQYGQIICKKGSSGLPAMKWRPAKAIGSNPSPRFGHVSLPTSSKEIKGYQPYESRKGQTTKLLVIGGYGGGAPGGNWRLRKRSQGYRMDKSVLDLGIPFIEEIFVPAANQPPVPNLPPIPEVPGMPGVDGYNSNWFKPVLPTQIPKVIWPGANAPSSGTTFVTDTTGTKQNGPSGSFVSNTNYELPLTMTIKGKNFHGDVGVTIGNTIHGPYPCKNVVVKSPIELTCELTPGVGTDLDIIVHGNNQHALPGNHLFSYDPPRIIATVPPFIVDFCWPRELKSGDGDGPRTRASVTGSLCPMRGPILLIGTNFGPSQKSIQSITFGSAKCLTYKWISQTAVVCLCVGASQRDQLEQPLQGGVQIKVGDQYSNMAPFLLVGAPQILIHTYPGVHYPVICPSEKAVNDLGYFLGNDVIKKSETIVDQARRTLSEAIRKQEPEQMYQSSISHTMSINELKKWQLDMYSKSNIGATEAVSNVKAMLDKLTCRKTCVTGHGVCDYPYESKRRLLDNDCLKDLDGKCVGQPNRIRKKHSIQFHVNGYKGTNEKIFQKNIVTIEEKMGKVFQHLVTGHVSANDDGGTENTIDWSNTIRVLRSMDVQGEQDFNDNRRHDVPIPKERVVDNIHQDIATTSVRGNNYALEEKEVVDDVTGVVSFTRSDDDDISSRKSLINQDNSDIVDESLNKKKITTPTDFPIIDLGGSDAAPDDSESTESTESTSDTEFLVLETDSKRKGTRKLSQGLRTNQQQRTKGFIDLPTLPIDLPTLPTLPSLIPEKVEPKKGISISIEVGLPFEKKSESNRILYILRVLCKKISKSTPRTLNRNIRKNRQQNRNIMQYNQNIQQTNQDISNIQSTYETFMKDIVHVETYTIKCPTTEIITEEIKKDLDANGHGLDGRVKCKCELGWGHATMTEADQLDLSPFSKRLIGCEEKIEIEQSICERTCNSTRGTCKKVLIPKKRRAAKKNIEQILQQQQKIIGNDRFRFHETNTRTETSSDNTEHITIQRRRFRRRRRRLLLFGKIGGDNEDNEDEDGEDGDKDGDEDGEEKNNANKDGSTSRGKKASVAPLSEYSVISCWHEKAGCIPLLSGLNNQPMTIVKPFHSYTFGSSEGTFGKNEKINSGTKFSIFSKFDAVVLGLYQIDDSEKTVWARIARTHAMEESMTETEKLMRQKYRKYTPDGDLSNDLFINLDTVGPVVETDYKHWSSLTADERKLGTKEMNAAPWWWSSSGTSAPDYEWKCECNHVEGWKNGIGTPTSSQVSYKQLTYFFLDQFFLLLCFFLTFFYVFFFSFSFFFCLVFFKFRWIQ